MLNDEIGEVEKDEFIEGFIFIFISFDYVLQVIGNFQREDDKLGRQFSDFYEEL